MIRNQCIHKLWPKFDAMRIELFIDSFDAFEEELGHGNTVNNCWIIGENVIEELLLVPSFPHDAFKELN